MSNILTAIRKEHGEIAELILPMVDTGQESSPPADQNEAAVIAVLRGDERDTPAATAKVEGVAPKHTIRQLPLHISGLAPLLPFDNTNPIAAEQYRIMRTRLVQHPKHPRMLLISSAGPSDGKTVTAINIAGALALKSNTKVLLADTDFRRSTIHLRLGLPSSPGLADVLSGTATLEEALIQTEQFPNLYVISAGQPRPDSCELLDSTRWETICKELRNLFGYVIADAPPVASVADYDLLQAACDGVVLVARPDHTKREALLKIVETIPSEKLIGVVMNCVEDWFLSRRDYYAPYYYSSVDVGPGPAVGRK